MLPTGNLLSFDATAANRPLSAIVAALFVIYVFSRVVKLWRGINAVGNLPGFRVPFQPLGVSGAVIPTTWWNPGLYFTWKWRAQLYSENENLAIVPFLAGVPAIYTSNLDVIRQVVAGGHRSGFKKPAGPFLRWGMSILTSEGEVWRRHRRIMGPALNNKTYQLVWEKTAQTYHEMVACEGWTNTNTVDVPVVHNLTTKVALLMINICGFGLPFNWAMPPVTEDGSISVQEAFRIFTGNLTFSTIAPKWAWKIPIQSIRKIRTAHGVLEKFMHTQVAERQERIRKQNTDGVDYGDSERQDILSTLVLANDAEGKLKLDDNELMGNVFAMLVGGHETTSGILAATLGLLALHQDAQDEVVEQINAVIGPDCDPTFEDYPKLNKVLSVFYEALRMFPVAYLAIREAAEDTMLIIPNPVGQEGSTTVPILKGVQVIVDWIGVQNNPRYFDEADKFKPSRWHDIASNDESVSAFGVGPRACIGRKFATTEAVCFLTMLLRAWRVEPLLQPGEDIEGWQRRTVDVTMGITMHPLPVPLRFTARSRNVSV